MAIEIVDLPYLPMKNGDFPSFLVCLPEGMVFVMENPHLDRWMTARGSPFFQETTKNISCLPIGYD